MSPRASLRSDTRATSVVVGYVLAIGITTILASGLLIASNSFLDDQAERTAQENLETIGNRLAGEIEAADRLVRNGGTVKARIRQPRTISGGSYTARVAVGDDCKGPLVSAAVENCLVLRTDDPSVTVRVPLRDEPDVTFSQRGSGTFSIVSDGNGAPAGGTVVPWYGSDVQPNIGIGRGVKANAANRRTGNATNVSNRTPIADFTFSPGVPTTEDTITFRDDTTDLDGEIRTYEWDFGDGGTATGPAVDHAYLSPGRHTVTLTVTDDDGATDSVSKVVSVSGVLYNDDAITRNPDNDGTDGGMEFSIENTFDDPVTITEVLVDPRNDDITEWEEGYEGSELEISADRRNGEHDFGGGTTLSDDGLIVDAAPGAILSAGSDATIGLYEFDRDMAGETVTIGVRYEYRGQRYASRFEVTPESTSNPPDEVLSINAGGEAYTASDGTVYRADTEFDGGRTAGTGDPIANTEDDPLYQSERYGDFSYDVPVENGEYRITGKFAEIYWNSPNRRVFNVSVEGNRALTDFDIYNRTGHDRALDFSGTVRVSDGELNLDFETVKDNATLSAIKIERVDNERYQERNSAVVMEAEQYTGRRMGTGSASSSEWNRYPNGLASGDEFLIAVPNKSVNVGDTTRGPRLDYEVAFNDPGTYYVWVRTAEPSGADNSVHVGLDGTPATYGGQGIGTTNGNNWEWTNRVVNNGRRVAVYVSEPGVHTINVWMREDFTPLDKIVLARNPDYVPTGTGPPTSPRAQPNDSSASLAPLPALPVSSRQSLPFRPSLASDSTGTALPGLTTPVTPLTGGHFGWLFAIGTTGVIDPRTDRSGTNVERESEAK